MMSCDRRTAGTLSDSLETGKPYTKSLMRREVAGDSAAPNRADRYYVLKKLVAVSTLFPPPPPYSSCSSRPKIPESGKQGFSPDSLLEPSTWDQFTASKYIPRAGADRKNWQKISRLNVSRLLDNLLMFSPLAARSTGPSLS